MSKCCVVPLESTWCTIIRKHWYASTRQTRNSIRQQYDQSPLFSSAVWDKPSGLISREGWWGHPSRIGSEWSFLQPWWIIPLFCDVGSWDELTRFLVTARTAVGVGGWCLPSFSPLLCFSRWSLQQLWATEQGPAPCNTASYVNQGLGGSEIIPSAGSDNTTV